ncbi:MAG: hypothetical protein ACR2NG_07915, partial [Acidimicrobiia bacterium]
MTHITFLQLRPSDAVNEIWASTRRREGTLAVELASPTLADIENSQRGGLVVISGDADVEAPAFAVEPAFAGKLRSGDVDGWRITIIDSGTPMEVLDALAFTGAAYLRTSRSSVGVAASLVDLPGLEVAVSTFVDSVEDAIAAVADGATDLLLRDWDIERLGELRDGLASHDLVERTAFPVGIAYD